MTKYADLFQREEIDEESLPHLTEAHLQEIGIPLGPALKIINALRESNPGPGVVGRSVSGPSDSGPSDSGRSLSGQSDPAPAPPQDYYASIDPPLAASGEHRQVTVLYCDLVQSTELTRQLGSERYAAFFAEYIGACLRVAEKYEQEVSVQKGDGLGICFGLTTAREDDTDHAVRAAIELNEAVSKVSVTAGMMASCRIGIATGAVAVVSSAAFGDVMNLASRLQDLGGPGDIIVADSTRRICGDAFMFIDTGYRHLKGFAPQRVWRVSGSISGISRFEARRGRGVSPLTGREEELRELHEHWRLACHGQPKVVCIEGDAGIGKSRLVRELVDDVMADQHAVTQSYQCTSRRQNTAYYPLIEQLERTSGIQHHHTGREKQERLLRLVNGWKISDDKSVQALATLLGSNESETGRNLTPVDLPEQTVKLFMEQLRNIAGQHPILIVFEDIHWIDSSTADLLIKVVSAIKEEALPILVLLTHRPIEEDIEVPRALMSFLTMEIQAQDSSDGYLTIHKLEALKRHESFAIIKHVAKGRKLTASLLESIADRADDVPLFVEEVTKYVLEFGKLYELDEHQPLLLERIQPYLTGRLDGLGKATKEVAQVGSVIGRRFSALLVSRGLNCDIDSLEPQLHHLVQSELVYRQGDGADAVYVFKHALVQDAAYGSLFLRQKRNFHRRIAEALEEGFPQTAAAEPDVLAWHFTEADEPLKAIHYWCKAGERSISRSAMAEARRQFERGEELVHKYASEHSSLLVQDRLVLDSLELDLLAKLGIAVYALEGSSDERLLSTFERVLELAAKQGRPDREFDAHLGLSNYYYVGGNLVEGNRHIGPCLSLAEKSEDEAQFISAHRIAGELAFYMGDLDRAIGHLGNSIGRYSEERHGDLLRMLGDDPGVLARMYLAISLWLKGEVGDAFRRCQEGIAIAERLGHEYTLGQAAFDAAWLCAIARDYDGAKVYATRAVNLCSNGKDEFRLYLGCSSVINGWIMTREGHPAAGVQHMKRALPLIEHAGAGICLSCFLPWLAEGLGRAGEIEEGLKVIQQAHEVTTEHFYDAERLRIEGELRRHIDRDGARRCFLGAIEASRKAGMKSFELRAAYALHEFDVSQSKKADPAELFGHLLPWIECETQSAEIVSVRKLLIV